jgi:5-methylcytosine-specific restriction endonuclease McrA
MSQANRESLKAQSAYRCACCGDRFGPRDLVIDHLIPLGLLGADAPGNWLVMSRAHNGKKWDRFVRGRKLYRTERF